MNSIRTLRLNTSLATIGLSWLNVGIIFAPPRSCNQTSIASPAIRPGLIAGLAMLVWLQDRGGATAAVAISVANAGLVCIVIYGFRGSGLQIDLHMYIFAVLAICAALLEWRALVAYATVVAAHHLTLFFALPAAVFPADAYFSRVVLHAVILSLETGVLIAMVVMMTRALLKSESTLAEATLAQQTILEIETRNRGQELANVREREWLATEAEAVFKGRLGEATAGIAEGIRRMAEGNLAFTRDKPFAPEFEALRGDLNETVTRLGGVLGDVSTVAHRVDVGATDVAGAVRDLSQRTEQQAGTVQQTATALAQITESVVASARCTQEVRAMALLANTDAAQSSRIVEDAENAMHRIEKSSQQIASIITVIDEIAFQTNLLALNAGVEAARAGDAGRGFAVVAQEVRELAQRSASAAREIKGLIQNSSSDVENGVKLVRGTGEALSTIGGYVVAINGLIDQIAVSSREQSESLSSVTSAVGEMDRVTQQNAAMVEQTTASGAALAKEAMRLKDLVSEFNLVTTRQDKRQRRAA